jgi:integrase
MREGIPAKAGAVSVDTVKLLADLRRADLTAAGAALIVEELKRQGLIRSAVFAGTRQDVDFADFLTKFWTWETSDYIAEKLRKKHGIHKNYARTQLLSAQKYWTPFFTGCLMGELTRADIEAFVKTLDDKTLSPQWKNHVLKAGTIPLKWAFKKDYIERDITSGLVWYSGKAKERPILTPELAEAVFQAEWTDGRAKLANMLSMVTGMRAGEIQGLRMRDLGRNCLHINHSWNYRDGLKPTKNNEGRRVELPFPEVVGGLLALAGRNPHGATLESFVFWADKLADKPAEQSIFLDGLRGALQAAGMTGAGAKVYTFHGWRHYFTAYMRERVTEKLLQKQTGHKTHRHLCRPCLTTTATTA